MIAARKPVSFPLGKLVATPEALSALTSAGQSPAEFLDRHTRGDWGEVDGDDWALNDEALEEGTRILSATEPKPMSGSGSSQRQTDLQRAFYCPTNTDRRHPINI